MNTYARTAVLMLLATTAAALGSPPLAAQQADEQRARASAWLGIGYDPADTSDDVVVQDVAPGSPAFEAGIRTGHVIVRIGGEPASVEALVNATDDLEPGDTIRLRIRGRDGEERTVALAAAARPPVLIRSTPGGGVAVVRLDTMHNTLRAILDSARITLDRTDLPKIRIQRTDSTFTFQLDGEPIVVRTDSLRRRANVLRLRSDSLIDGLRTHRYALRSDSLARRLGIRVDSLRSRVDDAGILLERTLRARGDDVWAPTVLRQTLGLGGRAVAGAEFTELNPGLGRYFDTDEGLLVLRVLPDTPAARAGLEAGDVVVGASGRAIRSIGDLRFAMTADDDGDAPIPLEIVRDGSGLSLEIERDE